VVSRAGRKHSRYRAHTSAQLWKNIGQGSIDYNALVNKAIMNHGSVFGSMVVYLQLENNTIKI